MPKVSELPAATGNIDILYGIQDGVSVKLDGGPAYVDVRWFGAVADGVTDDSAAFIAARTAADGKTIRVPAGHYKLNAAITGSEDLNIEGDGDATILDFTGTVTGGNYALDAIGTATQIQDLGTNATKGEQTITFASAPSLVAGDVFVIYNPTNSSWSGFRTSYRAGEWCEVVSVSGNNVLLRNPLYDSYTPTAVDVYKSASPSVSLRNFQIRGTTVLGLIKATFCVNPVMQNITGTHANNSVIYLDRCYKPTVSNPNIYNTGDGGDDYGISIGNSQHVRVNGGTVYARRHGVTHGGTDAVGCVPVRDSRIIGTTVKNDINSGVEAADFHGNTEDSSYIGCTIYNGANLQGKNNEYANCTITNTLSGWCIYHRQPRQ